MLRSTSHRVRLDGHWTPLLATPSPLQAEGINPSPPLQDEAHLPHTTPTTHKDNKLDRPWSRPGPHATLWRGHYRPRDESITWLGPCVRHQPPPWPLVVTPIAAACTPFPRGQARPFVPPFIPPFVPPYHSPRPPLNSKAPAPCSTRPQSS